MAMPRVTAAEVIHSDGEGVHAGLADDCSEDCRPRPVGDQLVADGGELRALRADGAAAAVRHRCNGIISPRQER